MTRSKGEYLCGKNAVPLKKIVKRQLTMSPLTWPERWIYISVWIGSVIYLCYSVFKTSHVHLVENEDNRLYMTQGWKWIGRPKDQADFEWDFWSGYLTEGWPWLLTHILLTVLCRKVTFLFKRMQYIYTSYAAVVLCVFLGCRVFAMLVVHTCIIYISALTGSVMLTWLVSIALVSTLNIDLSLAYMNHWLLNSDDADDKRYLLMMFTTAMCNLRYTSFAIEMCWHRQQRKTETENLKTEKKSIEDSNDTFDKEYSVENSPKSQYKAGSRSPRSRYKRNRQGTNNDTPGGSTSCELISSAGECRRLSGLRLEYRVVDMWFYCFYLPLFCTGPLLTYDNFRTQWQKAPSPCSPQRVFTVTKGVVRVIGWLVFCQVVFHYFYFCALMSDERLLSQMSLWSLAGIGFTHGQFFMVKYVVLFGVPGSIALFDELEMPGPPCCISVVYLYSQMWKEFDRGLYTFIKRYIYIPLGGSHRGQLYRFFASFCCFSFIFIWHGTERDIFVWTILNFLGVCVESLCSNIANSQLWKSLEDHYLGNAWSQRLKAFSAVPLFASSILAIFTFFKGTAVGYIYFERLLLNGWPIPILTVTSILYCCVQTAIEIDRWKRNRSVNVKQD